MSPDPSPQPADLPGPTEQPEPLNLPAAFEAWCARQRQAGRLRRGSSEAVYRAMWLALAAWCAAQRPPLGLAGLQARSLAAYLASRSGNAGPDTALTPRYQWRLLNLVQRVQADHAWQSSQFPPSSLSLHAPRSAAAGAGAAALIAAHPAVRHANAADQDDLPAHLPEPDAARLQALLCDTAPLPRWQERRDRCAVALQLGAGLGPGDLRALRLADVVPPPGLADHLPGRPWQPWQVWMLRVPASGSAPAHVTAVAPWAATLLDGWLATRQAQGLGGDWLLPSTRSGKPWGKVAQYEAARRVLLAAGLDADRGGSFRLRHSFALRQLAAGHDADRLARWLGVVDPAVLLRYQRVLGGTPGATTALPRDAAPV